MSAKEKSDIFEIGKLLYQEEEYELAVGYLARVRDRNSETEEWKGLANFQLGHYAQSEQNFKDAIRLGHKQAHIWFNLGYSQELQNKYEEAIKSYAVSVKIDADSPGKDRMAALRRAAQGEAEQ